MCRSGSEGSGVSARRCACNQSAVNRRHRRYAQKAYERNTPVAPNKVYRTPSGEHLPTMEDIISEQQEIRGLISSQPVFESQEAQDEWDNELEFRITGLGLALASQAEQSVDFNFAEYWEQRDVPSAELENLGEQVDSAAVVLEELIESGASEEEIFEAEEKFNRLSELFGEQAEKDDLEGSSREKETLEALSEAYRSQLAQLRVLGGVELKTDATSDSEASENLNNIIQGYYPKEWIEASNQEGGLRVLPVKDGNRPHCTKNSVQEDLNPQDYPEFVSQKYVAYVNIPVPAEQLEEELNILGDKATVLDARPIPLNGDWCYIVQMPHQRIFDPEIDSVKENGEPAEPGWELSNYINPSTQRATTERKWVKTSPQIETVAMTEMAVKLNSSDPDSRAVKATALHEFGHRAENTVQNGLLMRQEEAFLRRRTTNPETGEREDLSQVYPNKPTNGLLGTEFGRRNSFLHHYIGKEYVTSHNREVLTVGVESVFAGSLGGLNGLDTNLRKTDNDLKGFILGLFATV